MIKTFEQFVSEIYDKPINEAFQSNKLRELIKQHGKPKYSWDNKMLYDLKDNEIIDVVSSNDEYWKKYHQLKGLKDMSDGDAQATFKLELEDGYCIVISNLDILKNYWGDWKGQREDEEKIRTKFKEIHSKRHVGNLGKGGDNINKRHLDNVYELKKKRLISKLQPNIPEIIEYIKDINNNVEEYISYDMSEDNAKTREENLEKEITLGGKEFILYVDYSYYPYNFIEGYGVEYFDVDFEIKSFSLLYSDDEFEYDISNEDLGITPKDNENLFSHTEEKIEGNITNYYDYYGVSPSDFL